MSNKHPKFFGYVRESSATDEPDAKTQELAIREYLMRAHGAELSVVFRDRVAASVPFLQRPEVGEMLAVLEPGTTIIAQRADRAFRNASDCVRVREGLASRGVRFVLVEGGDIAAKAFASAALAFSQLETERIRERTLTAQAKRRSQGKHVAGRLPFGFVLDDAGFVTEHDDQQRAIGLMLDLRHNQNKSFAAIAAELKSQLDVSLSPFSIQRILRREQQRDDEERATSANRRGAKRVIRTIPSESDEE